MRGSQTMAEVERNKTGGGGTGGIGTRIKKMNERQKEIPESGNQRKLVKEKIKEGGGKRNKNPHRERKIQQSYGHKEKRNETKE